jgi:hydrogenase expression/formation protein HypE
MKDLIDNLLIPAFDNESLRRRHDAAVLEPPAGGLAFTTDSYVVDPIFFPGGDIGSLAVFGTVNDLAMAGARPWRFSCGLILEEGLSLEDLARVVVSMRDTAGAVGVSVVTGDTKVVDRGKGDGIYINTSGIGVVPDGREVGPWRVKPGDVAIVSGDIGRHGIAVLTAREGFDFETSITSDCSPLTGAVEEIFNTGADVHCMRDLTRGGLGAALIEIAESAGVVVEVDEPAIPVADEVRGPCELLGFDPIFLACEGRFVTFVDSGEADGVLAALRGRPGEIAATVVGQVSDGENEGRVTIRSSLGISRFLDLPSGEQLPRIC